MPDPETDPDPIRDLLIDALAGNADLGRLLLAYFAAITERLPDVE